MSPARNAVRLVIRKQRNAAVLQKSAKKRIRKTLGRDIKNLDLLVSYELYCGRNFIPFHVRAKISGRNVFLFQRIHLVFHKRDQRLKDDGHAVLNQCRQLKTQTLPRSCGQNGQHIPSFQKRLDNRLLTFAIIFMAENRPQRLSAFLNNFCFLRHGARLSHPLRLREVQIFQKFCQNGQ